MFKLFIWWWSSVPNKKFVLTVYDKQLNEFFPTHQHDKKKMIKTIVSFSFSPDFFVSTAQKFHFFPWFFLWLAFLKSIHNNYSAGEMKILWDMKWVFHWNWYKTKRRSKRNKRITNIRTQCEGKQRKKELRLYQLRPQKNIANEISSQIACIFYSAFVLFII